MSNHAEMVLELTKSSPCGPAEHDEGGSLRIIKSAKQFKTSSRLVKHKFAPLSMLAVKFYRTEGSGKLRHQLTGRDL